MSSSNYVGVAQETLSASNAVLISSSLVTGAEVVERDKVLEFVKAQLPKLPGWVQSAPSVVTGVVSSVTEACSGGGSMQISVNDRNNSSTLDAGDSFSIVSNACIFSGSTINGSMNIGVNSLTGDLNSYVYSANFSVVFSALSVSSSAGGVAFNGNMGIVSNSSSMYSYSESLSSDTLSVSSTYGGTNYSQVLAASLSTNNVTPVGSSYSQSTTSSGTLTSSNFANQSVSFSTIVPLVRAGSQSYPASGQVVVTGLNGSKARITAQSSTQVLIELDADGNGTYETSTTRAWSSLL